MTTDSDAFDTHIETWKREEAMPWARIRRKVEHANLIRHTGPSGLKILDAGGGNGYASLPFARNGCSVVVADYSPQMIAFGREMCSELGLGDRLRFVATGLQDMESAISDQDFDVVLCNNVLQYVDDLHRAVRAILRPLKPGGYVAVICLNRYSIPYHQAFLRSDLVAAKAAIGVAETNTIFETVARALSLDEVVRALQDHGCAIEADYGLRCLIDYWGDNERKTVPATLAQLEELEFALTAECPYKPLARFFQVIARKL